jgi:hypothetical protein
MSFALFMFGLADSSWALVMGPALWWFVIRIFGSSVCSEDHGVPLP